MAASLGGRNPLKRSTSVLLNCPGLEGRIRTPVGHDLCVVELSDGPPGVDVSGETSLALEDIADARNQALVE
jgi:hypothetical protein